MDFTYLPYFDGFRGCASSKGGLMRDSVGSKISILPTMDSITSRVTAPEGYRAGYQSILIHRQFRVSCTDDEKRPGIITPAISFALCLAVLILEARAKTVRLAIEGLVHDNRDHYRPQIR